MSLRSLASTSLNSAEGLVRGLASIGSSLSEHIEAYHEDRVIRDAERSVNRAERFKGIYNKIKDVNFSEEEINDVLNYSSAVKQAMFKHSDNK